MENISLISSYWYRTFMNDKYESISIQDIIDITIMYHNASILAQNEDNITDNSVRIWKKKRDDWILQTPKNCNKPFDKLLTDLHVDLWRNINFMIDKPESNSSDFLSIGMTYQTNINSQMMCRAYLTIGSWLSKKFKIIYWIFTSLMIQILSYQTS